MHKKGLFRPKTNININSPGKLAIKRFEQAMQLNSTLKPNRLELQRKLMGNEDL